MPEQCQFVPFQSVFVKGGIWTFVRAEGDRAIIQNPFNHKEFEVALADVSVTGAHPGRWGKR